MSALSDHDDHSEELFADGGHASTTAPRRTALERDPQLKRIPVDQLDSGKLVVRQQPSATNRARIRWLTLARAGAAILPLPLAAAAAQLHELARADDSIPRLPVSDEQQPKPPEALSYVQPVQGIHQDAALPPAPSQIQRLGIAGIALHAPGNRLARRRPPWPSSTHPTQNRLSPGRHPSGPSATGRRSLWTPASSGLADPSRPRLPPSQ